LTPIRLFCGRLLMQSSGQSSSIATSTSRSLRSEGPTPDVLSTQADLRQGSVVILEDQRAWIGRQASDLQTSDFGTSDFTNLIAFQARHLRPCSRRPSLNNK